MALLLLPIFLYFILILWIAHHWFHHSDYQVEDASLQTTVTVLIPFKNEKDNLPRLMCCLQAQNYPRKHFDVIFINDHSTDGGEDLVKDFTLVHGVEYGKKAALKTGLLKAQGELIITLDADCLVGEEWLSTIVAHYEDCQAGLIICPVIISPVRSVWEKLQAIEFQSLAASTGGAALGGHAIMCNGANLAFTRTLVSLDKDVFNDKYVSGDDMFLLEYAKRHKAKITYLKSQQAIARTSPETWQNFWQQRSRWTSKSSGYRDVMIIITGLIVLLANLSLFVLPLYSVFYTFVAFSLKMLVDFLLLNISSSFFKSSDFLWLYFLLLPVYPIYVMYALIKGLSFK